MVSNEVYNLRWNNYQATLSTSVGTLLDDSDFIDVTIACEGQSFNAHKVVLSACSGYLKKLLKRNPCQHPIVILKDVRASVLNFLVQFMYHGAVDVPEDQLQDFLHAGQALEVKGLAEEDAPVRPKNISSPESSLPTPPKKPRLMPPAPSARTFTPSPLKPTSVISGRQARSLVESSVYSDNSARKDSDVIEKLQSSSVSITPSEPDRRESAVVKQEDDESDLEIMEPEDQGSMKVEAGTEEYSVEDDQNSGLITNLEDGTTQDYSYEDTEGSFAEAYEDGQVSMAGPSSEGTPQGEPCPYCGRMFQSKLKRHIERMHIHKPFEQWEPCPICDRRFKIHDNLINHMHMSHGMKAAEFRALTNSISRGASSAVPVIESSESIQ